MKLIEWNNKFSVQMKSIDKQHMRLIDLLNTLFKAMKDDKEFDILEDLINKLIDYTKYHFSTEETYFRKFNFELIEEHNKEHSIFINKLAEFKKDFNSKEQNIPSDILLFLRYWINDHILGSDKKYMELFLDNGVK